MKNLVYISCSFSDQYIIILEILLESLVTLGKVNFTTTDVLIMTDNILHQKIVDLCNKLKIPAKFIVSDIKTKFDAAAYRLNIFNYSEIDKYSKLLYLDCDIVIVNDINTIFALDLENKLYAGSEETSTSYMHGNHIWMRQSEKNPNKTTFSTGLLLFNNCTEIKNLFIETNNTIIELADLKADGAWEQPYLNYCTIKNNLYAGNIIDKYLIISCKSGVNAKINNQIIFYHINCTLHKHTYMKTIFLNSCKLKQSGGFKLKYILIS